MLKHELAPWPAGNPPNLKLDSGSRVAVIGGGPAGANRDVYSIVVQGDEKILIGNEMKKYFGGKRL